MTATSPALESLHDAALAARRKSSRTVPLIGGLVLLGLSICLLCVETPGTGAAIALLTSGVGLAISLLQPWRQWSTAVQVLRWPLDLGLLGLATWVHPQGWLLVVPLLVVYPTTSPFRRTAVLGSCALLIAILLSTHHGVVLGNALPMWLLGFGIGVISWLEFHHLHRRNEQLRDAMDQVEAAVQARSRFFANMSHEIRTPMNGILGSSDLLRATELEQDQSEYVRLINHSARALQAIVDDVLDMSKMESGELNVRQQPFNLTEVVQDVHALMRLNADAKGLDLQLSYDGNMPVNFEGDPQRIRQILLNLVSNAIKFTEQGFVRISVSMRKGTITEQKLVSIEVMDTGIGIDDDTTKRLFADYTQAGEEIARKYGGTGLGLAISRKLAELLGGSLTLESDEGEGTILSLRLPLAEASEEPPSTGRIDRHNLKRFSGKVLVAEDNAVNQRLVTRMLDRLGLDVDLAPDGVICCRLATEKRYDLILMDLEMPNMNGIEATQVLRNVAHPSNEVPIVAMTANAFQEDREHCLRVGMSGFLAKPCRVEELVAELENWLDTGSGTGRKKVKTETETETDDKSKSNDKNKSDSDWRHEAVAEV